MNVRTVTGHAGIRPAALRIGNSRRTGGRLPRTLRVAERPRPRCEQPVGDARLSGTGAPVAMSAERLLSSPGLGQSVGPSPQTERGDAQQQHASNHRRTPVPGPDPRREHHETDNGTKRRYGDR